MHFRLFITFLALIGLSSCLTQADQQAQADKIISEFHQAIQLKQWDAASQFIEPSYFKQKPKKHWQNYLNQIQVQLGDIESFNIISKSKDPRFGGDFYIYIVSIKHKHGFSHETVTIFQSLDKDTLSITGHLTKTQGQP
ncbi:MAG: hypothetical protein R8K49_07685 [Mariprofundaceae bacterium]